MTLEFKESKITDGRVTDITEEEEPVMHIEVDTSSRSPHDFGITWL